MRIAFCTSNLNKLEELTHILKDCPVQIDHIDNVELIEIQSSTVDISKEKCKFAHQKLQIPTLVEDTSLSFKSLSDLPGPYIKHFLQKLGPEGLVKLLSAYPNKEAYATCILSYWDGHSTQEPLTFEGIIEGTVVDPRGPRNFGWDCIFMPKGYDQTFAEMDKDLKSSISHRRKAVNAFREFILSKIEKNQE